MMIGDDIATGLADLRLQAESLMVETVQVSRRTGWTDVDGRQVPAVTAVYTGKAALGRAGTQPNENDPAGQQVTVQQQVVKFPATTPYVPQAGDTVTFTAGSGHLVGMKMRLIGESPTTSHPVQYRVPAERIV